MLHTNLKVYQKSLDFVLAIYQLTASFPSEKKYGITNQLRRAAVSIPCNIAEGVSKNSTKDYIRFLYISLGSVSELECLLEITLRLSYTSNNTSDNELIIIKKMLIKLISSLKKGKWGIRGNGEWGNWEFSTPYSHLPIPSKIFYWPIAGLNG